MNTQAVESEKVRRYFDREADRFDAIYHQEKGPLQHLVDHLFRQVIHRRFALALKWCGQVEGKTILDIGCGSGRYSIELARRGAKVVGLDFAPAMVETARQAAIAAKVENDCTFVQGNFLEWCEPHHFDICLAIGFFDYIERPGIFLEKIQRGTSAGIFSFPVRWTLRSLTRWFRLHAHGCPVYFYTSGEIDLLLEESGCTSTALERLSRDYLVHTRHG